MKFFNESMMGPYFTFVPSKDKPIYNWFFYKEAFSPEIIEFLLEKLNVNNGLIVDPFCGIGTTLLYSKSKGFESYGTDVSPLATFASKVKCEDYNEEDLKEIKQFDLLFKENKEQIIWKPELFYPKHIFPKASLNTILNLRAGIEKIENQKVKDLMLLALLSIIPQSSLLIKDGGVMKFDKRKSAFPAKDAFKRKVKRMIIDLEKPIKGPIPEVELGDARNIKLEDESTEAVITSPPYLNNIDYSKIYGLELSLLYPNQSIKQIRKDFLRSFSNPNLIITEIPPECEEFGIRYPLIGAYFADMEKVFKECYRILKPDKSAVFIVGNSIMYNHHILVDEILAEIGERLGFEAQIMTALKRTASTQKTKISTRESAVILRK